MQRFLDSKGNEFSLDTLLGSGGEGDVYAIRGRDASVAKIYRKRIDERKADKLRWMADHSNSDLLKFCTWVLDTVHSDDGNVVGFLMPRVTGSPIHQLYSPQSRKKIFPEANWRFLLRVAENLSTCFQAVHSAGQVVGDINHANCFVKPDGTVALIDCDSFSIKTNREHYETEVITSMYLPPELQSVSMEDIHRTQNHDNFGLAVLIFHLLFLGRHPFIGRPLNGLDSTLEEDIKAKRFAYGKDSVLRSMEPPPYTLDFYAVSQSIAKLFDTAFLSDGPRPTAEDWRGALRILQRNLKKCTASQAHDFHLDLDECPWCKLEQVTKRPIFEAYVIPTVTRGFDIAEFERRVANLKVSKSSEMVLPTLKTEELRNRDYAGPIMMLVFVGAVFSAFTLIFGVVTGLVTASLLSAFFYIWLGRSSSDEKVFATELRSAESAWRDLQHSRKMIAEKLERFSEQKLKLDKSLHRHRVVEAELSEELLDLEKDGREIQLREYLLGFRLELAVENGEIPRIGPDRLEILLSAGIRTAADLDPSRIRSISALGVTFHDVISDLNTWRNRHERRFIFDPDQVVPASKRKRVSDEIAAIRQSIEAEVQSTVPELERLSKELNQQVSGWCTNANSIASRLERARTEAAKLGRLSS